MLIFDRGGETEVGVGAVVGKSPVTPGIVIETGEAAAGVPPPLERRAHFLGLKAALVFV